MKNLITSSILALALVGVAGCAEDAGITGDPNHYTVPESTPYAAPSLHGQATGITGEPSGAGSIDLSPEAKPGTWDASRNAAVEQPASTQNPNTTLPPGSVREPQGGTVPATVNNGGNTAGTTTGR